MSIESLRTWAQGLSCPWEADYDDPTYYNQVDRIAALTEETWVKWDRVMEVITQNTGSMYTNYGARFRDYYLAETTETKVIQQLDGFKRILERKRRGRLEHRLVELKLVRFGLATVQGFNMAVEQAVWNDEGLTAKYWERVHSKMVELFK